MALISEDRGKLARELLYTTVFSQVYSPCGKFLAACSNFGRISIFSLSNALSSEVTDESWKPFCSFKAHEGPAYSLVSTARFLISAGTGSIKAWSWTEVISRSPKVSWSLNLPESSSREILNPEINTLATDEVDGTFRLYAGCGDNMIHSWDISLGLFLRSYRGHSDYIHAVTMRPNSQQFLSASEDGSVRVWDARVAQEAVHLIEPYKNSNYARPQLGKYLRCVAVDKADDWMVCGGGPSLSLWHLRSLSATTVFDTPGVRINHAMFHEDSIISGGTEAFVQHWALNGEKRAHVPCSPTNVFSVAVNNKSDGFKVLSIAGNCHKVDICTNFGYKAFSLLFR